MERENYILILAFNADIEKFPHRKGLEDYPSYLSNYQLDIHKGMCIQSGMNDAIKFTDPHEAILFLNKAKEIFPDWEFELTEVGKRVFGKGKHRFVFCK